VTITAIEQEEGPHDYAVGDG